MRSRGSNRIQAARCRSPTSYERPPFAREHSYHRHHLPALRPRPGPTTRAPGTALARRRRRSPCRAGGGHRRDPARQAQIQTSRGAPAHRAVQRASSSSSRGPRFRAIGAPLVALAAADRLSIAMRAMRRWARRERQVPEEIEPVMVVLLFGVITDYSIFFLSRFRRQLGSGAERHGEAAESLDARPGRADHRLRRIDGGGLHRRAVRGRSFGFFQAFGPGLAATTLITLAVSVTLVPALVALFGAAAVRRHAQLRERGPARRRDGDTSGRARAAAAASNGSPLRRCTRPRSPRCGARASSRASTRRARWRARAVARRLLAAGGAADRAHRHRPAGLRRAQRRARPRSG